MSVSRGSEPERTWNRRVVRTLLCVGLVVLAVGLVASGGAGASSVGPNATEISHCTEITEPGDYVLTVDIQPSAPENLTLDTNEYPHSACIAVNASGVVIEGQGYEINGSAAHANGSGQYYGIRIENLSAAAGTDEASALSARISNVTLTNWSRGVYAYNADDSTVNDSTIQSDHPGQDSGVYLHHSDNATVRRNVVDGQSRGIDLVGASHDANVTHNEVTNTSITAIESQGDRLLVANNHVEDFGGSLDARGILLEETEDVRIVDNVVLDGYEAIASFGYSESDLEILNNTLRGGVRGVSIDDTTGAGASPDPASAVVRNNTIEDFDRGIAVLQASTSPTIVDNEVTNVTNAGIAVFGGSDHGLVESNVVTASGEGLRIRSNDTVVRDNDFSGNDEAVDLRRSAHTTIAQNDLSGSGTLGVSLLGWNPGTVVANNAITDGAGTGVEITVLNDAASDVVLEGNEIARNQGMGVHVDNENAPSEPGPRNPVIRGNDISANGAEGIFDGDGIDATYEDNWIANNTGRGIYVRDHARNVTVRNNTVVDNGGVGVQLGQDPSGGTPNVVVEGNSLLNNGGHAIVIEEESSGIVVANNSMSDHDVDLRLHQVSGVDVHDNAFETGIGFGVEAEEHYVHEMSGNAFHDGSSLYYAAGDPTPSVPQDAGQVIVVDADGLALSNLDVTTGSVPTGLLVATSNGSTIENVSVTGPAGQGIRAVSLANATVERASVDGARRGIVVETSPGIDLRNASVTNVAGSDTSTSDGIEVTDSAGAAVRDSYVHNTSGIGIDVAQVAGFLLESSAVDETGGRGVIVGQSPGATVRTSSIIDATYAGVLVTDASNSTVEGLVVMNNSASANTGIRVLDSDEVALLDNQVQGIGGEGISTANAVNVTIIGTYAYDNDVGIAVGTAGFGGEANAVLLRNEVLQNDLGIDGQQVTELVNNTIRDNLNVGASIENADGVTVTENLVRQNGDVGLDLGGLSDVTVANNEFYGNDIGIRDTESVGLLIDSNALRHHDTQSIELHGTDEFTVRNNTIEATVDSGGFGISAGVRTELASGDVGSITDNTFNSNDYGIQVAAENADLLGANLTIRDNEFVANPEGVRVYHEADEIMIANNAFNGTTGDAVSYGASSPSHYLDARGNWWGAASGPSGGESDPGTGTVANGSGDAVGSNVRFDPWLGDDSSVGSNLTADVSVVAASVNATEVEPNGVVTVTADVRNVGNATGTYSADLEIDGSVEDTIAVEIAPTVTGTVEFTYAFAATGEYDVTVSGVAAGTVTVAEGGTGSGGDGGGGGDGGTGGGVVPAPAPTPAPGPEVTVEDTDAGADVAVTNVRAGDAVTVPLDGTLESGGFELTALSITLSESVDFEATIEARENAPADAGDLPNGTEAMAYLDVSHRLDDGQVESATFEFTVSTAELEARSLAPDDVVLYHSVDGEWVERETTAVEEREDAIDFRAEVPHFSWFAVAGVQSTGSGADDSRSDETGDDGTGGGETGTGAAESEADQAAESDEDSSDGSPGFGLVAAVLALIGAAHLLRRETA